ncbi:MAG: sigma factor-like helix-turn-helix DNA-binding protein [Butyricimonas faecihominis]
MLGQLYRAIEELPTECARVFKLGLEGLSNQEIADTLSVSIHTVKTQKQRAMSVLKRRFGIGTILVMFGMTDFFI